MGRQRTRLAMCSRYRMENILSEQIEGIFLNLGLDIIIYVRHSFPPQISMIKELLSVLLQFAFQM